MTTQLKQTKFFFEGIREQFHPAEVPADWLIFNTSRPLEGTLNEEVAEAIKARNDEQVFSAPILSPDRVGVTWQSSNGFGLFFAAVDPSDPQADFWIERNNSMDAHLCVWVTREEVKSWVYAYVAKNYPDISQEEVDDFEHRELVTMYLNHN